jgi:hypothetical protein
MFSIGDKVRLSETARQEFLTSANNSPHSKAVRENRIGTVVKQVGVRGRHLVVAYLVDFDSVRMTIPEEDLVCAR